MSNTSSPRTPRRPAAAANTGANAADSSGRRKACNECRQQKLRCDLLAAQQRENPATKCSRCHRLDLECKVDNGFVRTRKRRRSVDLEKEIRHLRQQLEESHGTTTSKPSSVTSGGIANTHDATTTPNLLSSLPVQPPVVNFSVGSATESHSSPQADDTEQFRIQNVTTRPGLDEPPQSRELRPYPPALGNIVLSIEEIDHLFSTYLAQYHPFLPMLNPDKPPQECFQQSELLFWIIVSVASRRLASHPTLLPRLARNVTDLLWRTIRCVPQALSVVQALAILCTWPFPISSSTADPTFMLAGLMLQLGTQMGLHRVRGAQDFRKSSLSLDASELREWERTWEACYIVAQSVGIGCGLPNPIQPQDWPRSLGLSGTTISSSFTFQMRIEKLRQRVSSTLAPSEITEAGMSTVMTNDRLVLYRLHSLDLDNLYTEQPLLPASTTWHLAAARLHLQAFYLLDSASIPGYNERICNLYTTSTSILELGSILGSEAKDFLLYCPFFSYQTYVCAAFCVLKIISNGFYRTLLDTTAGAKHLENAIASLRVISVVNNDLPARLGDVIAFFCAMPNPTILGGTNIEDVRLIQVTNRLSMSVVYDCLWTWRRQFQPQFSKDQGRGACNEDKFPSLKNLQQNAKYGYTRQLSRRLAVCFRPGLQY
ncbi:hypothetical protein CC79DRAFT_1337131 [Sarocladium strictum]